jgi:stage II sporulation protein D
VIARAAFLKGLLVATGGLDIWSSPEPLPPVAPAPLPAPSPGPSLLVRVATPDGSIATLDVETYLRGVVPVEASASWPAAALEAQAILARTYALAKRTLSRGYDLVTTVTDQRYGGQAAERPATSAAVDATRSLTLGFDGGPASVFYHACCGGHTEDAAAVWGHTALPYLRGVDDPYCAGAPDFRWVRTLPLDRARAAVADRLGGALTGVDLLDPDPSGRPRTALLHADAGSASIAVTDLRARWGADIVRSTFLQRITVEATQAVPFIRIEGAGRGHGVGLCQWGARGMALAGADAAAILAHYFPGTAVTGV